MRRVRPTSWDLGNLSGLVYLYLICEGFAPAPQDLAAQAAVWIKTMLAA